MYVPFAQAMAPQVALKPCAFCRTEIDALASVCARCLRAQPLPPMSVWQHANRPMSGAEVVLMLVMMGLIGGWLFRAFLVWNIFQAVTK